MRPLVLILTTLRQPVGSAWRDRGIVHAEVGDRTKPVECNSDCNSVDVQHRITN